jgi:hypothetical protein
MKNTCYLFFFLLSFYSCVSDEERRLQTDQTFEGEEMFNIALSLEEHALYAFYPYSFYQDTANYARLSGCPTVSVSEAVNEVVLTFAESTCETNKLLRSGKLKLTYIDSLLEEKEYIRIEYDDYWTRGINLKGTRFIEKVDSTAIDSTESQTTYGDSINSLLLIDAHRSSSKITGNFTHEVLYSSDSILHITTSGAGFGRNIAGRPFQMNITQPKVLKGDCLDLGFFVAESGQESWTIDRSVEADAFHLVNYQKAIDCNHNAGIQLSDGSSLSKTQ